jgi:hypothetical protein
MSKLRRIGAGFCGSVWATPTQRDSPAFKREDGGPGRSLFNDFEMHNRVLKSFYQLAELKATDLPFRIQLPQCYCFTEAEDQEWWDKTSLAFLRVICHATFSFQSVSHPYLRTSESF